MNDLLCLGKVARINFPSTVSRENWSYRFKKSELGKRAAEWLKALAEKYQR
ncbi:MAG: 4-alpha-glucanotransferase [Christensenellaceae bacterium]